MGHFAEVDKDGVVLRVIVAEQDFIDKEELGPKSNWVQTSYNTRSGVHSGGKTPLRKNFAGIGYQYDSNRDAFLPKKKYDSWVLDEDTCQWKSPKAYPADKSIDWQWDESTLEWVE
jgi:hypothetical protein